MIKLLRPYFYKYVTAEVAKRILTNREVQYSDPRRFNDPFDTQIDLHYPFDLKDLRKPMMQRILDAANSDTPLPNADTHPTARKIEFLRQNWDRISSDKDLRDKFMPEIEEGIENMMRSLPEMHQGLRDKSTNDAKVFCVSEVHDNLLMWSHYSNNHKGAVIKFLCLPQLDNLICTAKPIVYNDDMPVMATLKEFIDDYLGFKSLDYQKIWDRMFSVKSIDWKYEREWRVIIPGEAIGTDYTDLKIYPQEVGKIILGCRMSDQDTEDILNLLTHDFDHVTATKASKNPKKFRLDFEPVKKI
jgi:hypothetical protein